MLMGVPIGEEEEEEDYDEMIFSSGASVTQPWTLIDPEIRE